MTLLPQHACCRLLGIDPKTLRRWLALAQIPFFRSPTDARCRCLTAAHIQYLAKVHHRPLAPSLIEGLPDVADPPDVPAPFDPFTQILPDPAEATRGQPVSSEAALSEQFAQLQQVVVTLQEQLTQLALDLLQERRQRDEQQRNAVLAHLCSPVPSPVATAVASTPREPVTPSVSETRSHPTKGRPRSIIPLIEYVGNGSFMILSPQHGELPLRPDSREWFAWLSTLTSFRFIGQHGRLSTHRQPGQSRWMAYRYLHGRRSAFSLGSTDQITIARLEYLAAILQSETPSPKS